MDKYLEAGRLSRFFMNPYLTEEEGLAAVYKYAEVYREPITNESAILINKLCFSDPFFISCVVQSNFEEKDLSTEEGAAETVNYEITNRQSEMSMTWREYIDTTLDNINDRYAKQILLHLSKHHEREWTPGELKQVLTIDLSEEEIHRELLTLSESDLIERGNADIDFRGLKDGTLNLVLRNRFEKEIKNHQPDLKKEFVAEIKELKKDKKKLQGMLNHISGLIAETQLAVSMRSRKRFKLMEYFDHVGDEEAVNLTDVKNRVIVQRDDGRKFEIDLLASSTDNRLIAVEVKKTKTKTGRQIIEDFLEKTEVLKEKNPDSMVLPMVLSLGGFTEEAARLCREKKIGMAEKIKLW
jgi:DNA-binding Lrp family transcriptional regulator